MYISFRFTSYSQQLINEVADKISVALSEFEFNSFSLSCHFNTKDETEIKQLRRDFQFPLIKKIESLVGKKFSNENAEMQITIDFCRDLILLKPRQIYLYGRYNKFCRNIAQTKHFCYKCKGRGCNFCSYSGKKTLQSVQELVAEPLMKAFCASDNKFHGAGREDVDVLMLGSGRPFVIELIEPKKRNADLGAIEEEINLLNKEKIKVTNLQFTTKEKIAELKAATHKKLYAAIVECSKCCDFSKIQEILGKALIVEQYTPIRVARRRAKLVRKRTVVIKNIKKISDAEFYIELLADSGLYIKEFISGDNNRTKPSISSIFGVDCKCKQLDVLEIVE